jgi:NitT/TauT family transport system substrate-binding protein
VVETDPREYREELAELFPKVPVGVAIEVVDAFRKNGMWTTATIPKTAFDRWQQGLTDARFVREPLTYESIVDSGPAQQARAAVESS